MDLTQFTDRISNLGNKAEVEDDAKISFYCEDDEYGAYPPPTPAHENLPDWYKAIPKDIGGDDTLMHSVKACQPLYDAMSAGWLLRTPVEMDVQARPNEGTLAVRKEKHNQWISSDTNSMVQMGNQFTDKIDGDGVFLFQFKVPWIVETADDYVSLILPTLNRPDSRFQSFAGVIDTDKYPRQMNAVLMWTDPEFEGIIERGTPFATVIPVRREDLGGLGEVKVADTEKLNKVERHRKRVKETHMTDGYRKEVWEVKPSSRNEYEEDEYKP